MQSVQTDEGHYIRINLFGFPEQLSLEMCQQLPGSHVRGVPNNSTLPVLG